MESFQFGLCGCLLLFSSLAGISAQEPTSYSSHREVTTAALTRITQAFLESMHPAKNGTAPVPPTLRPEQRQYIDAVFRRHLGYGVPSTYLHYVETVCGANELMMHPRSNRQNNFFWHRYTFNGKLNMNISARILREWKAAAIDAVPSYHQARILMGQALHVVQDGYRVPDSEGLLYTDAINASVDYINEIADKLDPVSFWNLIGMRSPFRGREIVIVIDKTFRAETVQRLRALNRWAADYAAANWTKDIPPKFSIHYPDGIRAVFPSQDGLQMMTTLITEALSDCANPSKSICEPDLTQNLGWGVPRRVLEALDAASRYSEVGSTIFLLADTGIHTEYRMHIPFLQSKQQQLIIIGDPIEATIDDPTDARRDVYSDFAEATGGTAIFSPNKENDIYRSFGYLHHASKDNLVITAAMDNAQVLEQTFEIHLLPGDIAVGILIGRQDISIDLLSSGTFQSYSRGQWINAPGNLTSTWNFKVKGATKGWSLQAYVQSDLYYNAGLYQLSDWTFYNELSSSRPWEHKGYTRVQGNPIIGELVTVLLTRPACDGCDSGNIHVELIDAGYTLLETVAIRTIDDQYYGADIRVPMKPFRVAVTGNLQPYTCYSKLFTPTHLVMSLITNRPVDALPLQTRTAGTITVSHPEDYTGQLTVKESYGFLPNVTTEQQTNSTTKYAFNITTENQKFTQIVAFVALSDSDYSVADNFVSADNFVLQQVTAIAGERPISTKCAIVNSTHGQCTSCSQVYSAKMRLTDEYDGFLHNGELENIVGNWTISDGLPKVLHKKYLTKDGNVVVEVSVTDAKCCETVRAFARDANGEEGMACDFVSQITENAGASAMHVPLMVWVVCTVMVLAGLY